SLANAGFPRPRSEQPCARPVSCMNTCLRWVVRVQSAIATRLMQIGQHTWRHSALIWLNKKEHSSRWLLPRRGLHHASSVSRQTTIAVIGVWWQERLHAQVVHALAISPSKERSLTFIVGSPLRWIKQTNDQPRVRKTVDRTH